MKISKKLLREIYDISIIIGQIKNSYLNDRDPNRAQTVTNLADKGLQKCQVLIDSQDPL